MSWVDLDYIIPSLEARIVNDVYRNIFEIRSALVSKGYVVDSIYGVVVSSGTQIYQVVSELQKIEDDLDVINAVIESINYNGHKDIGEVFTLQDYQRWIMILNDLHDIVIDGNRQWGQMYLLKEDGTPDAQDVFLNDIYIRGERIG